MKQKVFFLISFFVLMNYSCDNKTIRLKIGFLMDSFETKRWEKDRDFFVSKANELGAEVIVKSADGNDSKQFEQAVELINKGVKVLVIVATNTNNAAKIVRQAHKKNVKVIGYARMIDNAQLDYLVSFDVSKIGELQAKYILNKLPEGNYVLINGDKLDNNALLEYKGVMKILKPKIQSEQIKILYNGFIDSWSPSDAEHIMKQIIEFSNKKIQAVIVGNDGMAGGVYQALAEYGLSGSVFITGLDAEASACKRILEGDQSMTVYMSIKKLAYTNAELAVKLAKNENINYNFTYTNNGKFNIPTIVLEPQTVDKENLQKTVVADGFLSMKEIEESSN